MAKKSRLGKGLGALFPDLPSEARTQRSMPEASPDVDAMESPMTSSTTTSKDEGAASDDKVLRSMSTPDPSDTHRRVSDAVSATPSHDVSRETSKRAGRKRRAIPALQDIAHPSDVFFGVADESHQVNANALGAGGSRSSEERQSENRAPADVLSDSDSPSETSTLQPVQGGYLAELDIQSIGPNAHQPRTVFDEDELEELSASIKEVGVLQPIVVRERPVADINGVDDSVDGDHEIDAPYELIMGERRWRASQRAGLTTIPAIVKTEAGEDDMLRDALLENLHRVALNPLEEAAAYQQMIEEFGLTQSQLSQSISKSRPQIANTLRLLNLPGIVQKKVAAGVLSAGHARALLGLRDERAMERLAERVVAEGLSVRSTEEIVALESSRDKSNPVIRQKKSNPWANSAVQQTLENRFDTKVSIKGTQQRGRIEIVFATQDDMNRILSLLVPPEHTQGKEDWV